LDILFFCVHGWLANLHSVWGWKMTRGNFKVGEVGGVLEKLIFG
jgi:hypothetical protein